MKKPERIPPYFTAHLAREGGFCLRLLGLAVLACAAALALSLCSLSDARGEPGGRVTIITNDAESLLAHFRRSGAGLWLAAQIPMEAEERIGLDRWCIADQFNSHHMIGRAEFLGIAKLPGLPPHRVCRSEAAPAQSLGSKLCEAEGLRLFRVEPEAFRVTCAPASAPAGEGKAESTVGAVHPGGNA